MVGKITGLGISQRLDHRDHSRPSSSTVPVRSSDRRHAGAARSHGHRGIRRGRACMLPGWRVEAVEDVNFLAPFKFYRNEPRTVTDQSRDSSARRRLGGRLPFDWQPDASQPGRTASDDALHGSRAAHRQPCRSGSLSGAARTHRTRSSKPPTSIALLPWAGLSGAGTGMVGWRVASIGQMAKGLPDNHHPSDRRR